MRTRFAVAVVLVSVALANAEQPKPLRPIKTPDNAKLVRPIKLPLKRGKAEIGAWGFDTKGMNASVTPGTSFYSYANGKWAETTPIPDDKADYGMFTALSDKSEERTRQIIEAAAKSKDAEAKKVSTFYKSFIDEGEIEDRGIAPIFTDLDRISAIKDQAGLLAEFGRRARQLGRTPFTTDVAQDERAPTVHIAILSQGGLGLPDRDMYDVKATQFAAIRDGYKKYLTTLFTLLRTQDASTRAAAVYALEEKLAAVQWTRTQNRDPVKTYNKLTIAQLQSAAPDIDWKLFLASVGFAKETALVVQQPSAITGAAKLVKSEPLAVWKDYLLLRMLDETAPYLTKQFVDANFEMRGKVLSGTKKLKERWKRGVDEVTRSMGEAVGKLYVAKHFPPATKARADKLVSNLLTAMGQRLDGLTWMSADTKGKAKAKLATYNPKIGYPKKWRDYSKLEIKEADPIGNATRAAAFEYDRNLAKLGQPVDRDEWWMTPMTVNAYYNAVLNEIVFPAAILQPPFFDPNADDAVNYGGIGAVIGHEISHGFDDRGSQYDATGALKNWWTADDAAKFKAATSKLVAQYSAYCPLPKQCIKGDLTLGENIADLAGLTISYQAYRISLNGKEPPVIDGMTGDQRFFLGWAQIWRRQYREQELANRLVTDTHSPSEFRAAIVRNLEAWYTAFTPKSGETLYLASEKRVTIW